MHRRETKLFTTRYMLFIKTKPDLHCANLYIFELCHVPAWQPDTPSHHDCPFLWTSWSGPDSRFPDIPVQLSRQRQISVGRRCLRFHARRCSDNTPVSENKVYSRLIRYSKYDAWSHNELVKFLKQYPDTPPVPGCTLEKDNSLGEDIHETADLACPAKALRGHSHIT